MSYDVDPVLKKALKALRDLKGEVSNDLSKRWIWRSDEIEAIDTVIEAIEDCI